MHRFRRCQAVLVALFLLVATATPSTARAAEAGPVIYDLVLIRPVTAAHTLLGLVMFVPAGLLSLPSGGVKDAWATFVYAPSIDAFQRPLGEF
ncbi:MAG: hypothetical protein AAF430_16370 [Myxococcota bacterium]